MNSTSVMTSLAGGPPNLVASSDGVESIKYVEIAVVFFGIFLVGIVGNSLVIFILFRQRSTWNVTTTYLFNLALADATFVCTLPMWAQSYLNHLEWHYGIFACKTVGFLTGVNMFASIFFLTAMSVDRWIAVVHSTSVGLIRTSKIARIVSICIWLGAGTLSIPRLILQRVMPMEDPKPSENTSIDPEVTTTLPPDTIYIRTNTEAPKLKVACMLFMEPSENKELIMGLMELIQALIGFVIPMFIICLCYARIIITVKKKLISKRLRKERVAVLAALIITVFFICWLPFQIMMIHSSLGGWWNLYTFSASMFHKVIPFCICLAYANSCINPFIYAFTATNFKNNVKDVCGTSRNGRGASGGARTYKMTIHEENLKAEAKQLRPVNLSSPAKIENGTNHKAESMRPESSYETYEYYSCPPVVEGIFDVPTDHVSNAMSGVAFSTPEFVGEGLNNNQPLRKYPTIEEGIPLKCPQ